jgi:Holliday junction resolvase RusA-like endonuclease
MMRLNIKPLSINEAFQGRRFKTKKHKDFEEQVLWILKGNIQKFDKDYSMHLKFYLKNALRCDLSNYIKVLEDCIVKSGIVKDDRFCWRMEVEKIKSEEDYIEFEIKALNKSK